MDRKEFLQALDFINPGLKSNDIIEESEMIIFDHDHVHSYNDEVAVTCAFNTGLQGGIHYKELHALLKKLKADKIQVNEKDDQFEFKCGDVEAGFNLIKEMKPPPLGIDKVKQWRKLPADFSDALAFCEFSASANSAMGLLTCIRVTDNEVWSCDNLRATRYEMKGKLAKGVLLYIPRNQISNVIAHVPKKVAQAESWIHFMNSDETVFSCRTMGGDYPPVETLLKDKNMEKIQFPDSIREILSVTGIALDKNALEVERLIDINLKKNQITCRGQGPTAWIQQKAKIKYNGKQLSFSHNPLFLSQILEQTDNTWHGARSIHFKGDNFYHVMIHLSKK